MTLLAELIQGIHVSSSLVAVVFGAALMGLILMSKQHG